MRPVSARPSATAGSVRSWKWRWEWKGITSRPSAASAAVRVISGPRAPSRIGGGPKGLGPGTKVGGISVCVVCSPRKSRRVPSCHAVRIARTAPTISRIRAAGGDQRAPYLFSMWGWTCEPRPRRNRPPLMSCRSHAVWARCIGERGIAIATLVIRSASTWPAIAASGRKTSCGPSKVNSPAAPAAVSSRARARARSGRASSWRSTSTAPSKRMGPCRAALSSEPWGLARPTDPLVVAQARAGVRRPPRATPAPARKQIPAMVRTVARNAASWPPYTSSRATVTAEPTEKPR